MSDRSKIEWTDASWNPLRAKLTPGVAMGTRERHGVGWHCEHVTEACRFCYAEAINRRLGTSLDYKPGHRAALDCFLDEKTLLAPLRWKKPRKIFPCSMTDVFGDWVTDDQLDRIFAVMALCPQHTFIVLTKRPERMREYLRQCVSEKGRPLVGIASGRGSEMLTAKPGLALDRTTFKPTPLPNVWLLVSICDQADADKFIPILLDTPAAVRGVSYEPALGAVDLREYLEPCEQHGIDLTRPVGSRVGACVGYTPGLDWLILGGESGPHARPMHPDWARQARDQCAAAGVPFFFKQWGRFGPGPEPKHGSGCVEYRGMVTPIAWPDGTVGPGHSRDRGGLGWSMYSHKGKEAGRLLDGVEHNAFPESVQRESEAA